MSRRRGPHPPGPGPARPRISLLHATFHRQPGPLEVKLAWLAAADRTELVEYVIAMDADDDSTMEETRGHLRAVSPPGNGQVTSVRNWNAAAAVASGDLLMVIADDLFPPEGWDTTLVEMISSLDPDETAFALKIGDSPHPDDTLLRHPVVSRAFYQQHGLFSPNYRGVYCDDDITRRAFWRSMVLDGRALQLEHRHPELDKSLPVSESQRRINSVDEYERGLAMFTASWSRRQRDTPILLVATAPSNARLSASKLVALQIRIRLQATATYYYRRSRRLARRVLRKCKSIEDLRDGRRVKSPQSIE